MNGTAFFRSLTQESYWSRIPDSIYDLPKRPVFRQIGLGLLSALGYWLGTEVGFALKQPNSPISILWPPNAILLAVFLLCSVRWWWIPIIAVIPVHLLVQLGSGVHVTTSLGWFVGNAGEALLGAVIVRRYAEPRKMFESVRGTAIFLCGAVVLAPLATTFWDAATVIVTGVGTHYWSIWTERFFSNVLAELIFVPMIVSFWTSSGSWTKESTPAKYLEGAALITGLLIASFLAFGMENASFKGSPALVYIPLSLLLWAALRFGLGGLSVSMLTIALASSAQAMHGKGPFTGSLEMNVLSLQILLSTVATPLMLLTAVMRERKRTEDSLREVAQKLIGAQELERERIARELHDDIGQQLTLVQIGLDDLKNDLGVTCKAEVFQLISRVDEVSQSARELSHELHPAIIGYVGLTTALRALCNDMAARKKLDVSFKSVEVGRPPAEIALCLYRIAQEGLQNALRHGRASTVSVIITETDEHLRLCIVDNGIGFDVDQASHEGLGLIGMRERLRVLDGDLRISSTAGGGTTIDAAIPLSRR